MHSVDGCLYGSINKSNESPGQLQLPRLAHFSLGYENGIDDVFAKRVLVIVFGKIVCNISSTASSRAPSLA
jgi:hypothetical protein